MIKLTDTQRIILCAASQRDDRLALPLPKSLKGGAAQKVIKPLILRGFLEEVDANGKLGDPIWRETGDGHAVTLVITDAGLAAIDASEAPQAATRGNDVREAVTFEAKVKDQKETTARAKAGTRREGTKQAALIDLLRRREGATIDELVAVTGWQKHTIRGAMAGALKKKLGLTIDSDKVDGRGRVYKIAA